MTTPEQLETRMLRDRAAIRDEQLAQAQENALLLYQALAKHAPDALAEIKPRLHANIREMDKVVCEVTAAREEAARLRDILVELTDATAYGQPGMLPYPDIQVAIVPGLDVRDIEIFQAAEKALDAAFAQLGFERSESTKDGKYVHIVYKKKTRKGNANTP